jgi:hypothetical protein
MTIKLGDLQGALQDERIKNVCRHPALHDAFETAVATVKLARERLWNGDWTDGFCELHKIAYKDLKLIVKSLISDAPDVEAYVNCGSPSIILKSRHSSAAQAVRHKMLDFIEDILNEYQKG